MFMVYEMLLKIYNIRPVLYLSEKIWLDSEKQDKPLKAGQLGTLY